MDTKAMRLLYRSLDAGLSEKEQRRLESALSVSGELRAEREKLLRMRAALAREKAGSFGPWFADRVMAGIAAREAPPGAFEELVASLVGVFRPVAVAVGCALLVLLPFNLFMETRPQADATEAVTSLAEQSYALCMEENL